MNSNFKKVLFLTSLSALSFTGVAVVSNSPLSLNKVKGNLDGFNFAPLIAQAIKNDGSNEIITVTNNGVPYTFEVSGVTKSGTNSLSFAPRGFVRNLSAFNGLVDLDYDGDIVVDGGEYDEETNRIIPAIYNNDIPETNMFFVNKNDEPTSVSQILISYVCPDGELINTYTDNDHYVPWTSYGAFTGEDLDIDKTSVFSVASAEEFNQLFLDFADYDFEFAHPELSELEDEEKWRLFDLYSGLLGKTVYLLNDLDFTGDIELELIERFSGTLEGNNHEIKLLKELYDWEGGLFGTLSEDGVIENLTVSGELSIIGYDGMGGIIGDCYGTIKNCTSNVTLTSEDKYFTALDVGGMIGNLDEYGHLYKCTSSAQIYIKESQQIGGLVGKSSRHSLVENCKFNGLIEIDRDEDQDELIRSAYIGGIIGCIANSSAHRAYNEYFTEGCSVEGATFDYYPLEGKTIEKFGFDNDYLLGTWIGGVDTLDLN